MKVYNTGNSNATIFASVPDYTNDTHIYVFPQYEMSERYSTLVRNVVRQSKASNHEFSTESPAKAYVLFILKFLLYANHSTTVIDNASNQKQSQRFLVQVHKLLENSHFTDCSAFEEPNVISNGPTGSI